MKKIRILYDDGCFLVPHGGVSRYFVEMIKRLPHDVEPKLAMVSTENAYLQKEPFNLHPQKQNVHDFIKQTLRGHSFRGVSYVYKFLARCMPYKFPSGELANDRCFAKEIKEGAFDVLHLTAPHPAKNNWKSVVRKRPIVVTVHDLIPELIYGDRRAEKYRRQLLKDATHIIAVSENTKKDLISLYGVPEDKITVIYHGYLAMDMSRIKPYELDMPYILYVGKRGGYKNFTFLVKAIAPLLRSKGIKLFCTGNSFTKEELGMFSQLKILDRVVQKFVSDDEMMSLFAGAIAFVYPSKYEGFGIPILDAFSARCPVVLSRSSCFPEVAGDAALYFKNDDAEMLRSHIITLRDNLSVRKELIMRGLARLSSFSWEQCAELTANVYKKCIFRF